MQKELLNRIQVKQGVCFRKPCIKGTRIWVVLILDSLAVGKSIEQILKDYPQLRQEDILACLVCNKKN